MTVTSQGRKYVIHNELGHAHVQLNYYYNINYQ